MDPEVRQNKTGSYSHYQIILAGAFTNPVTLVVSHRASYLLHYIRGIRFRSRDYSLFELRLEVTGVLARNKLPEFNHFLPGFGLRGSPP